ncbi:hypothetical protein ABBQ38_007623 [Trebouxia sp. C0009 RCD-2024]
MRVSASFAATLVLATLTATPSSATANNAVTQWNSALQRTIRKLSIANQISSRYLSLVHVAQYQALTVNEGRVNETAVAAFAAHFIASEYFPNEINDGSQAWAQFRFAPLNTVGAYQPATANQTSAVYPQLAGTNPWILPPASQFVPQNFANLSHAEVGTPEYDQEYEAVKLFGYKNSTARNPYQQETPYFWADDVNTAAITGHWNNITALVLPSNISLTESAELFARLNVAFYDSNIAGWYIKFETLFWRPITAITQGDPAHPADPAWNPLLNTPAHPEFPSTHSVSSGAAAAVLARYFGTDNVTFEIGSEYPKQELKPRRFSSFSSAAIEIANSRVYGGIHFPSSGPHGLTVGVVAGDYVYANFKALTPSNGPAPSVNPPVSIPVSDGSFYGPLSQEQPQPGVEAPLPAPTLPTITLASQANGSSVPSSAAPAPQSNTSASSSSTSG